MKKKHTIKNLFILVAVLIIISKLTVAQAPTTLAVKSHLTVLEVRNTSQYIGKGRYKWKVYLEASQNVLGTIRRVQYTLHPTFKDTLVNGNSHDKFSYTATGWGEFSLYVNIYYINNRYERLKYWLKL